MTDFATEKKEKILRDVGVYLDNITTGMDREKYILMCETMGDEIDPDKMPPEFGEFPRPVRIAFEIFNALPDLYTGGMTSIFSGKDYSSLPVMLELFKIEQEDALLTFEVIQVLDLRARKRAYREAVNASKKGK